MTKADIQAKIKAAEERVAAGRKIVTSDEFDPSNAADQKAQADYEAAAGELGALKQELAAAEVAAERDEFNTAANSAVDAEFQRRGWQVVDKDGKRTGQFHTFREEAQKIIQGRASKPTAADAANIASMAAIAAEARIANNDIAPDPAAAKDDADKDKDKDKKDAKKDGKKDGDDKADTDDKEDADKKDAAAETEEATGENEDGINDSQRKEGKNNGSKMDNALDSLLGWSPAMLANPAAPGADNLAADDDDPATAAALEHLLTQAVAEDDPNKHATMFRRAD